MPQTQRKQLALLIAGLLFFWSAVPEPAVAGNKGTSEGLFSLERPPVEVPKPGDCVQYGLRIILAHRGCTPRPVTTFACKGQCHSRSIPEWDPLLQRIYMVNDCKCCKPLERRFHLVPLQCPGKPVPQLKLVMAATGCRCRPCSHGQVEAEQPYDY